MTDPAEVARIRTMLDHVDARLRVTRDTYLDALNDTLLFVLAEAATPTRRDKLAPAAAFAARPGDTISHRLDVDGYLMAWPAEASDQTMQRLNRTDLAAAAVRLGLHVPELQHGRASQ